MLGFLSHWTILREKNIKTWYKNSGFQKVFIITYLLQVFIIKSIFEHIVKYFKGSSLYEADKTVVEHKK